MAEELQGGEDLPIDDADKQVATPEPESSGEVQTDDGEPGAPEKAEPNEPVDYEKRWKDSSREAHELVEKMKYQQSLNEGLTALVREMQSRATQPQQPPPTQPEPSQYGPYRTEQEFRAAAQADPAGVFRNMSQFSLQQAFGGKDPQEYLQEQLDQRLMPLQQEKRNETLALQRDRLAEKYPSFAAEGSPERVACSTLLQDPTLGKWLNQSAEYFPDANIPEVTYKLATFDLLEQKVKALESQLGSRRVKASTARTGSASRGVPKNEDTPRGRVMAAAEALRGKGVEVDDATIKAAQEAFDEHLG